MKLEKRKQQRLFNKPCGAFTSHAEYEKHNNLVDKNKNIDHFWDGLRNIAQGRLSAQDADTAHKILTCKKIKDIL